MPDPGKAPETVERRLAALDGGRERREVDAGHTDEVDGAGTVEREGNEQGEILVKPEIILSMLSSPQS